MKTILKILICIFLLSLSSWAVAAGETTESNFSVKVISEDVLLDGMPSDFNLNMFSSKLKKQIGSNLEDAKLKNEQGHWNAVVEIAAMRHKLKPFHFKASYIIDYRYRLTNEQSAEVIKGKDDKSNEDQYDLIEEVADEIVAKITAAAK